MEHTSCGKECPFVKQGFCVCEKECPNYVESWWIEGKTQEQKLIKDCSPKRMMLQQQLMQNRLEGVQEALEQSRNEYNRLSNYLACLVQASQKIISENNPNLEVENEKNEKFITFDDNPNGHC